MPAFYSMNAIAQLLTQDAIVLTAKPVTKETLFAEAAKALGQRLGVSEAMIHDCLKMREQLGSTGLGQGVGIPHGRLKGLRQAAGMFYRLNTPIPFDAPDNRPVDLAFFLLVPEQSTEEHLQLLSELAQHFSDPELREKLRSSTEAAEVLTLFASNNV